MGFGGISIWQLLIILAIVILIFGGKKLRSLGSDLGAAVKGFKSSVKDEEAEVRRQLDQERAGDADDGVDSDFPTQPRKSEDDTRPVGSEDEEGR